MPSVHEILLAAEQLTHPPEVPGWEKLFARVRAGELLAEAHGDKAREAQVEFVMGAMMRSAGAEVSFAHENARAIFRGETVTFEAKRPNSEKNLGKAVREGRNQLARAGGVGVLFLDFSEYGYIRRGVATEVGPPGIPVPQWLRDFVDLLNRVNVPPESFR